MMRKPKELRGTAQSNYSEICKLGHILEQEGCSFSENEKQKKNKRGQSKNETAKKVGWSELLHGMDYGM